MTVRDGFPDTTGPFKQVIDVLARELPSRRMLELPGGHVAPLVSMDRFLAEMAEFQGLAAAN